MNTTTTTTRPHSHASLKGTSHKMHMQLFHGPLFFERLLARIVERLQPGYFDEENTFSTSISEGGLIKINSPRVTLYTLHKEEASGHMSELGEVVSCEYVEKINRYKVIIENFSYEQDAYKPAEPKREALVTFRRGGDYVAHVEGRDVYGPQLRKDYFTPAGFDIERLDGSTVSYTFTK